MSKYRKAVLKFAFCTLGLHKIVTGCVKENFSSERVMIKLGFSKKATSKSASLHVYKKNV